MDPKKTRSDMTTAGDALSASLADLTADRTEAAAFVPANQAQADAKASALSSFDSAIASENSATLAHQSAEQSARAGYDTIENAKNL